MTTVNALLQELDEDAGNLLVQYEVGCQKT